MESTNAATTAVVTTVPSVPAPNGGATDAPTHRLGGGLTLRSPREELEHIGRMMDEFTRRVFGHSLGHRPFTSNGLDRFDGGLLDALDEEPRVDLYEHDDAFALFVSLAGYAPEQIHVETTDKSFVIYGERQAVPQAPNAAAHRKGGVSSESRFRIESSLPGQIDPARAAAHFTNGVLSVTLPKTETSRPIAVPVPIGTVNAPSDSLPNPE